MKDFEEIIVEHGINEVGAQIEIARQLKRIADILIIQYKKEETLKNGLKNANCLR